MASPAARTTRTPARRRLESPGPRHTADPWRRQNPVVPSRVRSRPPPPSVTIPEDLRPWCSSSSTPPPRSASPGTARFWPGQASWTGRSNPTVAARVAGKATREAGWTSSVNMVTPRLGAIEARIHVTPQGARIVLTTPVGATAADLLDAAPALKDADGCGRRPLIGFQVRHEHGETSWRQSLACRGAQACARRGGTGGGGQRARAHCRGNHLAPGEHGIYVHESPELVALLSQ